MTRTVASGLCFGEGPRWHDGRLWFSDMHADTVYRLEKSAAVEAVAVEHPGAGWP